MKKTIKSKISLFLASAMTVTSLAVAPITSSADVDIWADDGNGFNEVDEVTVWIGGGKSTLPNGAIIEGKTAQLYAFDSYEGATYNVTTAKSTVWGLSENSSGTLSNGKFDSSAVKTNAKISKGKITAGKQALTAGKKLYALVFTGVDKKVSDSLSTSSGKAVEVNLKQAATAMMFTADSSGVTTRNALKSVAAPIDNAVKVYAIGGVKDGKTVKTDGVSGDNEYVISVVEKAEQDFVDIATSSGASFGKSIEISQNDLNNGFCIKGKALNNDKIAKASLLITSKASGKKAKLTVNVDNSVVAQGSSSGVNVAATNVEWNSSGKSTTTIELAKKFYESASDGNVLTDKAKVVVTTAADAANDSKFIDTAKGKVKITASKITGITAKYTKPSGKANSDKVVVSVDGKKVDEAETAVVVIVYNANKNAAGEYVGIIRIPVKTAKK